MVYFDLLYLSLLMRKQHINFGPAADRLGCRISIKMASQPCGGTIANTVRVFTSFSVPELVTNTINVYACFISIQVPHEVKNQRALAKWTHLHIHYHIHIIIEATLRFATYLASLLTLYIKRWNVRQGLWITAITLFDEFYVSYNLSSKPVAKYYYFVLEIEVRSN